MIELVYFHKTGSDSVSHYVRTRDRPLIITDYAPSMKYTAFIGADQPYSVIENYDKADGETCLVIKDSFGNAFVPFLIPHYKTIHIIDPRHYELTLSEFSQNKKIDDIIFISNISTTRNEIFIGAMEEFIK